jgi:hypothetical protein
MNRNWNPSKDSSTSPSFPRQRPAVHDHDHDHAPLTLGADLNAPHDLAAGGKQRRDIGVMVAENGELEAAIGAVLSQLDCDPGRCPPDAVAKHVTPAVRPLESP